MGLFSSIGDFVKSNTGTILGGTAGFALGGPAGAFLGAGLGSTMQQNQNINEANQQNFEFQKDQLAYQKDLQNQIFQREDNATQRRVADLKAAGLSPVLAAGSPAGSGAVVATRAPIREPTQSPDLAGAVMSMLKMQTDIATTLEQQKLMEQQIKTSKAQERLTNKNADIKKLDYDNYVETGISPNASPVGKLVKEFYGTLKAAPTLQPTIDSIKSKANEYYYDVKRSVERNKQADDREAQQLNQINEQRRRKRR